MPRWSSVRDSLIGQGDAPGIDRGAAGYQRDGLGRAAVVVQTLEVGPAADFRIVRKSPGSATPTWLWFVAAVKPPEPPVPIRLYALSGETVPAISLGSSL